MLVRDTRQWCYLRCHWMNLSSSSYRSGSQGCILWQVVWHQMLRGEAKMKHVVRSSAVQIDLVAVAKAKCCFNHMVNVYFLDRLMTFASCLCTSYSVLVQKTPSNLFHPVYCMSGFQGTLLVYMLLAIAHLFLGIALIRGGWQVIDEPQPIYI